MFSKHVAPVYMGYWVLHLSNGKTWVHTLPLRKGLGLATRTLSLRCGEMFKAQHTAFRVHKGNTVLKSEGAQVADFQ